jgi:hypothetical protein
MLAVIWPLAHRQRPKSRRFSLTQRTALLLLLRRPVALSLETACRPESSGETGQQTLGTGVFGAPLEPLFGVDSELDVRRTALQLSMACGYFFAHYNIAFCDLFDSTESLPPGVLEAVRRQRRVNRGGLAQPALDRACVATHNRKLMWAV